jgi:predicted RNase H-like nuclease
MRTILGIDAAWTLTEPSGVALLVERGGVWQCEAVAPSYLEFIAQSEGRPTNWLLPSFTGSAPHAASLLRAARILAGGPVHLVTLDMPIATVSFSSRRAADDAVSTEFGSRWCSAHSPSTTRPGPLGVRFSREFSSAGFPLRTTTAKGAPALLEVYPHPALLSLLKRSRRVPYKVSKSAKYWPSLDISARISALLTEFSAIHNALTSAFGPIPVKLPAPGTITTLSWLKRYEDALDALVCAWVGVEHLNGRTTPLGDSTAAIWCPSDVVRMCCE